MYVQGVVFAQDVGIGHSFCDRFHSALNCTKIKFRAIAIAFNKSSIHQMCYHKKEYCAESNSRREFGT